MITEIMENTEKKLVIKITIERPNSGMIMANGVAIPFDEYVNAWKNIPLYQPTVDIYPTEAQPKERDSE